jgi:two-component system NarL family response regulator
LFEAIKAGARGYLLKTTVNAQEITTALEGVMAGQVMLTPLMATKLVSEFAAIARAQKNETPPRATESADDPRLTEREREVLDLVAQGKTNKEIAGALCVAENTVRAHLRNILDKLHVHNRTQAAAFARREHT